MLNRVFITYVSGIKTTYEIDIYVPTNLFKK